MGRHGVKGRVGGPADDKLFLEPARSGQQSTDARLKRGLAALKRSIQECIHMIYPFSIKVAGNLFGPQWIVNLAAGHPAILGEDIRAGGLRAVAFLTEAVDLCKT